MKAFQILFTFLLFIPTGVFGQAFPLTNDTQEATITNYLLFAEDTTRQLTITEIKSSTFEPNFRAYQHQKLKKNGVYWGKISIDIDKSINGEYILTVGKKRHSDFASFFVYKTDLLIATKHSGYFTKGTLKDVVFEHGSKIRLNLNGSASKQVIYFRIENISGFRPGFHLTLEKQEIFSQKIQIRNWLHGMLQGLLWMMFIYNLLIYFMSKEQIYLFYSLYIIGLAVNFITERGIWLENLLSETPDLNEYLFVIFTTLLSVAYFGFVQQFLRTKTLVPKWHKIIQYIIAINILGGVVQLFTLSIWFNIVFVINFSNVLNLANLLFGMVFVFVFLNKKNRLANYFIIGTLSLVVGTLASIFLLMTGSDWVDDPKYFMYAGTIGEILLFSLGLGYRIRLNEKEKIKTQQELIEQLKRNDELQTKVNRELETKVRERTLELEQQKEEIETQTERLAEINKELEKLSLVASKTDNLVVITDENQTIQWVNEGFRDFSEEDFHVNMGKSLIETSKNPDIEQIIQSAIDENKSKTYTTKTTSNTRTFWTQTTLTPILDINRKLEKLIAIDTDITELKLAEEKITDSINYAKRLQINLFPSKASILKTIPDSFIFFRPRDVVSGDFYWLKKEENKKVIVVADSTGHGVPGAFMSILGINFLSEIFNTFENLTPNKVLDLLRKRIIKTLSSEENDSRDGMDIGLVMLDEHNQHILYSGAHHPLYHVTKNKQLHIIKGDRIPIGLTARNREKEFTLHTIPYQKGDRIYLFSDGFVDQIGAQNGRKYLSSNFKDFMLSISHLTMEQQKTAIEQEFNRWKGTHRQMDDVLIMGIKL